MERYSDEAIRIIDELHTERLDYNSEYLPLIDAAQLLAAYEDTGLTPQEVVELKARMEGEWMTDLGRGCADVTHWMPLPQPPKEVQGNGCAILRQAAEELEQLPAPEPLTPAQVKAMDYDKVWIDYGEDGEWGIIVEGLLYSISTLEGAGFVDMLEDAVVRGEDVERPSGNYKLYLQQPQSEEGAT